MNMKLLCGYDRPTIWNNPLPLTIARLPQVACMALPYALSCRCSRAVNAMSLDRAPRWRTRSRNQRDLRTETFALPGARARNRCASPPPPSRSQPSTIDALKYNPQLPVLARKFESGSDFPSRPCGPPTGFAAFPAFVLAARGSQMHLRGQSESGRLMSTEITELIAAQGVAAEDSASIACETRRVQELQEPHTRTAVSDAHTARAYIQSQICCY